MRVNLWDSASGDYSWRIRKYFTKRAKGYIILYDITERDSFNMAKEWISQLKEEIPNEIIIALVGNKIDRYEEEEVSNEEGREYANENGLIFYETSTLDGINVNECVQTLIQRIYDNDPKNKLKNDFKLNKLRR